MTSFADRLNVGCEGKSKDEDNTKLWVQVTNKMELPFIEMAKVGRDAGCGR